MRRAAKIDNNQEAIVFALVAKGATVQSLGRVGYGCPDLLIGYKGRNYLAEVKNPEASKRDQELREDQESWHKRWRGQVEVIKTPQEAMEMLDNR